MDLSPEEVDVSANSNSVDSSNDLIPQRDNASVIYSGSLNGGIMPQVIPMKLNQSCLNVKPYLLHSSEKYPINFLSGLDSLRARNELCDAVIKVGSKSFNCHKVVLSACCPYFRAMFTREMAESKKREITLQNLDEKAMEHLIDFAYTASIRIDEGNVQTILPAACLLQLKEIQDACCEFLKKQLDPSNCLGIKSFADTHACNDLLHTAELYTLHNFQDVMESEEFLLLAVEQLCDIISSDELNVVSEEDVFSSVMRWVHFNTNDRSTYLKQILKHVRLPLLNARFLVGVVSSDLLIKSDEGCRELVDEAKNYLLLPEERLLMQGERFKPRQPTKRGEVLFAVGGWCTGDAINSVER